MKKIIQSISALAIVASMVGCGKKNSQITQMPKDGMLRGVAPANRYTMPKPPGMVKIPMGTFHMGPSDEDINYSFTSRNKQISINGFWMDATEITNNEYRQFVNWVRDSIAATVAGYTKDGPDGEKKVDWKKAETMWKDKTIMEKIDAIVLTPDNRIRGRKEIDASRIVYQVETFNYKEAAARENKGKPRAQFIVKYPEPIYPDTLVWVRDFSYSYNEPMSKRYYSHVAFGNYPVVGVSWKQATAFCNWRSNFMNDFLESKKRPTESEYRLPTEAEWEYAARGGRSQSLFPWGSYYLRNRKGCILANFKPGRGNYPEDGGFYTVRADAYWPNDFGLYCMSGNVAEWTSTVYYEGAYNYMHDMNPDVRYNAKDSDPPRMKRKVTRGGSWKDIGYFLQVGTRSYEYQDTAKSYIGFRCVIDLPPSIGKRK